jgi:two-component system, sensor histidine kinase YesM
MKRKYFRSIQYNMSLAFSSFFIILIIVIGIILYTFTDNLIQNISLDYTKKLVDQVYGGVNSYIEYMKRISNGLYENDDIQKYLDEYNTLSSIERVDYEDKISSMLNTIQQTRSDINLIMVIGMNNKIISNRSSVPIKSYINYKVQNWYKQSMQSYGKPIISTPHIQNFFKNEYRWVVSLSQKIYSLDGKKTLGILLVDLNFNIIKDLCSYIYKGKQGYFFIVDNYGNIIYHPYQQLIYSGIKDEMINKVNLYDNGSFIIQEEGLKKIYIVKSSENTNWKIVGVTYLNELTINRDIIQAYYLIFCVASVMIIIIISILLSKRISKPITNLRHSMRQVENGNFNIYIAEKSNSEIGELERDFNIMIKKIKELMDQVVDEQEMKRKSEIEVLQAQINPHFLYNTLESIIWLSANNKNLEVLKMTKALSSLLRIGISKGEQIVNINEEIEHVRNYLIIQKMRYKEKLDFKIDADQEISNYKTIKLILQPIVENAIYHGIKNKQGIGFIKIKCFEHDSRIFFLIKDNGIGMSEERLKEVFFSGGQKRENAGIGINNVSDRIELLYGKKYGLKCTSCLNKGTKVLIIIPKIMENENG